MEQDIISLIRKLAPDLTDEIARRALILERIGTLLPVGRRQLAYKLNLPEREIRNTAFILKDLGYIDLNASGMTLTDRADDILEQARAFSKALSGLTDMENTLSSRLGVEHVLIAPGDSDIDLQALNDIGRICAVRLRAMLQSGNTLAVTGGRTISAVAKSIQPQTPLNIMVVPARGGLGRSVELQANTMASEIANRFGGHYRLIHLPDHVDNAAMQEMLKEPEVSEAMELLQRADLILHGIGKAEETMKERKLGRKEQAMLNEHEAKGECFGAYFNIKGKCLLKSSSVGVDLGKLSPTCRMIAAAGGSSKAEAIISVLRHYPHQLLVTDEGAARQILNLTE